MRIAFTICSNNYLGQAQVFCKSFKAHNPDYKVFICLVDRFINEIDYTTLGCDAVVSFSDLASYNLESLLHKYDIIELNTAVKPFFFKYLIDNNLNVDYIYYIDPDICFYSPITSIENELVNSSIVLTPHIVSPIKLDELAPQEQTFLNYGIYNLGFIGINVNHAQTRHIIKWWGERTFHLGYSKVCEGLFVDQLWMNHAPIFFKNVNILKYLGCNMGPWNLHERSISSISDGQILLTNGERLVFYHFSSFDYLIPNQLSKYYTRYSFSSTGMLQSLYKDYCQSLLDSKIDFFSKIECYYTNNNKSKKSFLAKIIEKIIATFKEFT